MTRARSLPRPARRVAGLLLHWGREVAAELGAVGPDDPRGRRFGAFGLGSVLAFPQGTVFNERYIHLGQDTMVGPYACLTAGMAPEQAMASDPVVRIGDRCVIGRGAHVENSVVMDGARIEEGASVQGSVLGPGTVVGSGQRVLNAVLGAHAPPS